MAAFRKLPSVNGLFVYVEPAILNNRRPSQPCQRLNSGQLKINPQSFAVPLAAKRKLNKQPWLKHGIVF